MSGYCSIHKCGADKQNAVIEIIDDGCGMSLKISGTNGWLLERHLNVKSLFSRTFSPKMRRRKGIGRFAVDKLGDKTRIITKTAGEKEWLNVVIDWSFYEHNDTNDILLFTDIETITNILPQTNSQNRVQSWLSRLSESIGPKAK